jgi:hypothetical protein
MARMEVSFVVTREPFIVQDVIATGNELNKRALL